MEDERRIPRKIIPFLSNTVVDNIARKVAEEPIPQHIIDEAGVDEIRQLRKEQAQLEMYDDSYMNWSGHR